MTSPISDYYLSLTDQVGYQQYSPIVFRMVRYKLQQTGMDYETYAVIYDRASPEISKLFMIMNIPFMILFLYPALKKKLPFIYDRLVFALHYFSFFLFLAIVINAIEDLLPESQISEYINIGIPILALIYFLYYSYKSIAAIGEEKTGIRIGKGIFLLCAVVLSQFLYRIFNFLMTYLAT